MAEPGPGAAGGYVAFISYSHKDAKMGRWLHRKLEGYRLPRRLAGTRGEDGVVPARLRPIFRDRDELPAARDLSERVRAALAVSRHLIVLCSPHSAASPWVAKEIATFREIHPGRSIFTAIVEGEPGQCFSGALLEDGIEPLAADLRKAGDGRRLGLLKLVAGLAGVGLDSLVQRDAAQRIRRVTWITVAALAGLLVMAYLTMVALEARLEAERQRSEAEGLVEFMLTDLRNSLEDVGRLDVMAAVNARAMRHYGAPENLATLSRGSLARRARILHAIGDDGLLRHDYRAALQAFHEAATTTGESVRREPGNLDRLVEHTKSLFGLGRVFEAQADWPRARLHYTDAASTADRLVDAAPSDPDHLAKAASAAVAIGNLYLKGSKEYASAQKAYEKAIRFFERAERSRPDDPFIRISSANAYAWLADSFYYRGLWAESLAARMRQHGIAETLYRSNPGHGDFGFRFAAAQRGLAFSLMKTDRRREGQGRLLAAFELADQLMRRDSDNAEWAALRAKLASDLAKAGISFPTRSRSRSRNGGAP